MCAGYGCGSVSLFILDICYVLDLAAEHFNPFPDDPDLVYKVIFIFIFIFLFLSIIIVLLFIVFFFFFFMITQKKIFQLYMKKHLILF